MRARLFWGAASAAFAPASAATTITIIGFISEDLAATASRVEVDLAGSSERAPRRHSEGRANTKSEVTDVQLHGNDATIEMKSTTQMTELPPFGATVGYAALLACFALIATTIGHGAMSLRNRNRKPF